MDPEKAFEVLNTINAHRDLIVAGEHEQVLEEVLDAWDALDTWLRKGGFLPSMWHEVYHNQERK